MILFGRVPLGYTGIRLRYGSVVQTLSPGWYFTNPFIERIVPVPATVQTRRLSIGGSLTRNGISVGADVVVLYQIVDAVAYVLRIASVPRGSPRQVAASTFVDAFAESAHRSFVGERDFDQLLADQSYYEPHAFDVLSQRLGRHQPSLGITACAVTLVRLKPPQEIESGMKVVEIERKRLEAARLSAQTTEVEAQAAAGAAKMSADGYRALSEVPGGLLYHALDTHVPTVLNSVRELTKEMSADRREQQDRLLKQLESIRDAVTKSLQDQGHTFLEHSRRMEQAQQELARQLLEQRRQTDQTQREFLAVMQALRAAVERSSSVAETYPRAALSERS